MKLQVSIEVTKFMIQVIIMKILQRRIKFQYLENSCPHLTMKIQLREVNEKEVEAKVVV